MFCQKKFTNLELHKKVDRSLKDLTLLHIICFYKILDYKTKFISIPGDLMNEDQLLGWLLHQKKHTEIPEVTDEMMDKLIETSPYLAVLFCKRSIRLSTSF